MPHRNQCNSKALSALLHVSAHDRPANTSLGVGLGCENYHEMAEPVVHEHQLVKCLVADEHQLSQQRLNPKKTIPASSWEALPSVAPSGSSHPAGSARPQSSTRVFEAGHRLAEGQVDFNTAMVGLITHARSGSSSCFP